MNRWRAVAALPAFVLLAGAAPSATKGVSYDFSMVTTADSSRGKQFSMTGKGIVAGGNARIEFTNVDNPQMKAMGGPFGEGSYLLFRGATKDFVVVDTKQKQYSVMDQDHLMSMSSAVANMAKFEMTNVHMDASRVQPDTTIDGFKSAHYRVTQQYHMKMSMMFIHQDDDINATGDYYYAAQFNDLINPYMSSGSDMATALFNSPDYTSQLKAMRAKLPNGVPLLVMIHNVNTDKKGKVRSGSTVMHATNLVRSDIPSSTFDIPSGYKLYEPPAQPAASASAAADTQPHKKKGLFHIP